MRAGSRPALELVQPEKAVAVRLGLVVAFALAGVAEEVPDLMAGDEREKIVRSVEAVFVPHQLVRPAA